MRKKLRSFILSFVLLGFSSCQTVPTAPKVESCTLLSNSLICTDFEAIEVPAGCVEYPIESLDGKSYECDIEYGLAYQCISPDSYRKLQEHYNLLVSELKKCKLRGRK